MLLRGLQDPPICCGWQGVHAFTSTYLALSPSRLLGSHMQAYVSLVLHVPRTTVQCCPINIGLLCMALHDLSYVLWLFAELQVFLGEEQAVPSGAAQP